MRFDPVVRMFRVYEGGGKGSPPPPDYSGAAQVQAASSREVADVANWANRPTVNTPWGQQVWSASAATDPSTGRPVTQWTQNFNLDPDAQAALDSQQRVSMGRSQAAEDLLGQATANFQQPFDWEGAPGAGSLGDYDPNAIRGRTEEALFQQQMRRIEPALTQAEDARRTRLANMGIVPEGGSNAWERAQSSMADTRTKAYQDAALASITGAGQEAQRELGLRTGAATEMDRQRQRYIAEEAQRRGMTLNELNALLTGQQVSMPQFPNSPNSTAAMAQPVQALAAANMQGNYRPQGSDWGSAIGGIANVASLFM